MSGLRLAVVGAIWGLAANAAAQAPVAYSTVPTASVYSQRPPSAVLVAQQPNMPAPLYAPAGPPAGPYSGQPQMADDPYLVGLPEEEGIFGIQPESEFVKALIGQQSRCFLPTYYDPFASQQFAYGRMSHTPYRLGWYSYQEAVYIASAPTHDGASGDFQATELNGSMRYATRLNEGLLFAGTGSWNSRYWSGPTSIAMPPYVDQFMADLQLSSTSPGPWNWMIGVTPQINSDFKRQLTSNAYMVDARAVLFNKISPEWTLAIGAAYWDRANNIVIPYGGVIWTPDDRWEVRAMFPKSRVSYFLGSVEEADVWLYGVGEYTVDAYQIDFEDATRLKDRAEFRDYRILAGLHAQRYKWSAFFEGGYITDRHVDFRGSTPGFGIGDSWILRAGMSY